ncbi:MAG: efflux RND transporter permease subunit, partial [Bacteroidota bacterium]
MQLKSITQRPIAVLTILVGLVTLSTVVLRVIPISLLPEANAPQISVQVRYANASALELEQNILRPIRNQLLQMGQLRDIRSRAQDGQGILYLDFEFGTSLNLAFIEANEKLDQLMGLLPRDLERPRVLKSGATDLPVFFLHVTGDRADPLELAEFTKAILKRRLEQVPEIAFVDRSGYVEAQIQVVPKSAVWQSIGLDQSTFQTVLQENNLDLGTVLIQDGQYQYFVRFQSGLRTVEDIANLYFKHAEQVYRLGDLAKVQMVERDQTGGVLFDDQQSIVFAIYKQADAQLFALQDQFADLLAAFRADYPKLNFAVTNDQSELLRVSIDNLRTSLLYGACFAILIMFAFFRNWRAPLLIGIAIPLALLLSLLGFYLLDISINIISLSGLILGVGLMIDNSIIVIENIRQYQGMGFDPTEAGVKGANEVIRPLISSALTTCSVFLPLIFLSGLAGALFYDQAVSISIALGVSLLLAYILLPTLWRLLYRKRLLPLVKDHAAAKPTMLSRTVDFILRYRWGFLLLFSAVLASMYVPLQKLEQATFPKLSRKAVELKIDWNTNLSFAENERRTLEIMAHHRAAYTTATAEIGTQQYLLAKENQSSSETKILFFLETSEGFPSERIQQTILYQYPEASVSLAPLKNIFDQVFGANTAPLVLQLQSNRTASPPSPEEIAPVLQFLEQKNIYPPLPALQEQVALEVDQAKVLLYDLDYNSVVTKLQLIFADFTLDQINTGNDLLPVVLSGPKGNLYERLDQATLSNGQGQELPINEFVNVRQVQAYKTIEAGVTGVSISLDLPDYDPLLIEEISTFIKDNTQLIASFTGQAFADQHTIRELSIILGIALLLLYLILAAQFESLVQPLIVMLTVPISMSGALYLLWLSGQSLNLVSIIGIIVMSGIVVNDAILKVDMMNRLKKEQGIRAAIHGAGARRLKPILMTSITTILALVPILFASGLGAELQRPLAFAVIGGLVVG